MSGVAPFGSWASPISIDLLLKGEIKLSMPRWDGDDLYWLEERPLEGGRMVVVKRAGGATADVTPAGFNARTRVHEYGGGSYLVADGTVWFTNYADQRPSGTPTCRSTATVAFSTRFAKTTPTQAMKRSTAWSPWTRGAKRSLAVTRTRS